MEARGRRLFSVELRSTGASASLLLACACVRRACLSPSELLVFSCFVVYHRPFQVPECWVSLATAFVVGLSSTAAVPVVYLNITILIRSIIFVSRVRGGHQSKVPPTSKSARTTAVYMIPGMSYCPSCIIRPPSSPLNPESHHFKN